MLSTTFQRLHRHVLQNKSGILFSYLSLIPPADCSGPAVRLPHPVLTHLSCSGSTHSTARLHTPVFSRRFSSPSSTDSVEVKLVFSPDSCWILCLPVFPRAVFQSQLDSLFGPAAPRNSGSVLQNKCAVELLLSVSLSPAAGLKWVQPLRL